MIGGMLGIPEKKMGIRSNIDPILGINLEGRLYKSHPQGENLGMVGSFNAMDHDLEDRVLMGEEGVELKRFEEVAVFSMGLRLDQLVREEDCV
ncbi:hypothetical protein PVK06_043430 [Gossypium arboreum]|uniref:Uncharacterized protein n=1 Tax=Gossypium arboreum TaxID=29729 RepID=A0ABR0MNE5_GOSAR|nr:hypothetical protein PVK06_043430 [Gossypium arboreum]